MTNVIILRKRFFSSFRRKPESSVSKRARDTWTPFFSGVTSFYETAKFTRLWHLTFSPITPTLHYSSTPFPFAFQLRYALSGTISAKKGIMYMAATVGSMGVKNSELKTITSTLFMIPRQMTAAT
jgi:hypothetical protein